MCACFVCGVSHTSTGGDWQLKKGHSSENGYHACAVAAALFAGNGGHIGRNLFPGLYCEDKDLMLTNFSAELGFYKQDSHECLIHWGLENA